MRVMVAGARVLNAAFFLATTIYAILTYSPFAYEQFIQPNMIAWLSNFVFLHTDFYWLALCVTMLTLAPHLRSGRGRILAWAYLGAGVAVGILLTVTRVLPAGDTPARSLAVAFAALVPIVWLGVIDRVTGPAGAARGREVPRSLPAALAAAALVWAAVAAAAPSRLHAAGGIAATTAVPQLLIGLAASLVAHFAVFTIAFLVLAAARDIRMPTAVVVTIALGIALHEVVLAPISISGLASWLLAQAIAVALVVGAKGATVASRKSEVASPESQVASQSQVASRVPAWAVSALLCAPVASFGIVPLLTTFDWGFMLQKLTALLVAAAVFAGTAMLAGADANRARAAASTRFGVARPVALTAAIALIWVLTGWAIPRLPRWLNDPRLEPSFALDAYSAADPSFRVVRQFLEPRTGVPGDAVFYAYLRANSSLKAPLRPVDVDFATHLQSPALASRGAAPDVFLFVIDSLRRDYLSVYNRQVTFTPRLEAFARDSFVFTRAFSRYGGTGLAVPSIWAGALVAHKQYVTPFAPMNALAKLLDAGNYRRIISRDHITEELFGLGGDTSVLDRRTDEMMHTFCGTMAELTQNLHTHADDPRPVFAHTRPLDLHIGNTRFASVPAGESYPGFFAPYAARVRRIDACFGDLIDDLKARGRYDNSIIIVMADHGDSLGEGLRWGHGYTIVPEVLRIPLLIRVPSALRQRFTTDVTRVSFGTDVTPSLYALLGIPPERRREAEGISLFSEEGTEPSSRRREAYLVASSYGAVYGVIRHNGRRLYIADAIEGRDSAYDLAPASGDTRLGMTDAERQADRALIRSQIDDVASWYGYPRP